MSVIPPLSSHPGGAYFRCGRWLSGSFEPQDETTVMCQKPATWHVFVTVDLDNTTCCDEHMEDYRAKWSFYAAHAMGPYCTVPGSHYDDSLNECLWPEPELDATAVLAQELAR